PRRVAGERARGRAGRERASADHRWPGAHQRAARQQQRTHPAAARPGHRPPRRPARRPVGAAARGSAGSTRRGDRSVGQAAQLRRATEPRAAVSAAEAGTRRETVGRARQPRGAWWLVSRIGAGVRIIGHAVAHLARSWWPTRQIGRGLHIVWQAIVHLVNDGGMTYAGHIAFMTLFSSFPFLIFLTTLAAEIGQTDAVQEFVAITLAALPPEVSDAIRPAIEEVMSSRR